jgi:hypothetical protein
MPGAGCGDAPASRVEAAGGGGAYGVGDLAGAMIGGAAGNTRTRDRVRLWIEDSTRAQLLAGEPVGECSADALVPVLGRLEK